jgi:hypothetical protein
MTPEQSASQKLGKGSGGVLLRASAPQRYLPQDTDVLRTLVRHHKVQLGELRQ